MSRIFPIQGKRIQSIPWAMIAPHEAQALRNHDQSLEVLARRCGLSASEALDVLADRKWNGHYFRLPSQREAHAEHTEKCELELIAAVDCWKDASTL